MFSQKLTIIHIFSMESLCFFFVLFIVAVSFFYQMLKLGLGLGALNRIPPLTPSKKSQFEDTEPSNKNHPE